MAPEVALPVALQLAAGLDAAHEVRVIHRDFKSGNVIVEGQGLSTVAVITDFGLSRLYDSDLTLGQIRHLEGTPGYIAPELFEGRLASPASDVYAFGIVLWEMLTGNRATQDAPDLATISAPEAWKRAIRGCLQPDPRDRPQSAGEAVALLQGTLHGTKGQLPTGARNRERLRLFSILGAAGVALLAGLAWFVPRAEEILHPLPQHRFIALIAASNSVPALEALNGSILESIHDRLMRAESRMKDLLVVDPSELPHSEDPRSLGANLTLTVSVDAAGGQVKLRLTDLTSGKPLRETDVTVDRGQPGRTIEAAGAGAAKMLGLPKASERLRDEDELAGLPGSVYPVYMAADELRRQPNDTGLDAAIEKYQIVLEAAPHFALGYARIAQAYTRKYYLFHDAAALEMAERNAEIAVRHNPESPSAVLSQALVYLYSGRTDEALKELDRVLQLDPGNPEILLYKAAAYRDSNKPVSEEGTYRSIILQRPNFYRAYNGLGMALFRQARYKESVTAFRRATQIAPRQALPFSNLGMVYLVQERNEEAETAFRASLDRAPTELAWLNPGDIAFRQANYRVALDDYQKARELKPSDDLVWRNVADCYAVLGNRKAMLENYVRAAEIVAERLRTNPTKGTSWMTMAFYQAKTGHAAEAEAALRKADAAGASSVQDQFTRAQALAVLGHMSEAMSVLAECVRRGLSRVEIELALDLKAIREDPAWTGSASDRNAGTSVKRHYRKNPKTERKLRNED